MPADAVTVADVADRYVEERGALIPNRGHPHGCGRPRLPAGRPEDGERVARAVMEERLGLELERHEAGLPFADVNVPISYKVGERVWLEGRADARRHQDGSFDLKGSHAGALALGPMGLDLLRRELARLG